MRSDDSSGSMRRAYRWLLGLVLTMVALVPPTRAHEGHERTDIATGMIFPRLSPSGEWIVGSYQGAIWKTPSGGGPWTRLTSGAGFDVEPAFAPDGQRIAFIRTRSFLQGTLQIIEATDGKPVPLAQEWTVRDKLHFDPAGQRLLAQFQTDNQTFQLRWLNLESGELGDPIRLPQPRQRVALSHDGRWIATTATRDLPDEQTGNNGPDVDIWKVPTDGGQPQKIAAFPARIYDLCWAADDQSLLVVTDLGVAHNDVWQIPLADPEVGAAKLTLGQADEDSPSVSRDGRWLVYSDNRHGTTGLVRRDLQSGQEQWLTATTLDFRAPVGSLDLRIVESVAGRAEPVSVAARVVVQAIDGKYSAPPGALYRLLNGDVHFYCQGQAAWSLPAGRYRVLAARGPEYRLARSEFEVRDNTATPVVVKLERWTEQRRLGWYSGENHIHANYGYGHWYNSPRTMLAQCSGEDLIVCNFMVANSDGDGVFDREFFRGRLDPLSTDSTLLYWNQEFRSTIWGHMTLLRLRQLVEPIFTGFRGTTNPHDHPTNADIADHTHDQDGHVNYTHPAQNAKDPYLGAYTAKELPLDVALGKVDSIDVMGTGHEANMPLWYRLLNCGFKVPASAGTDCFLNRIPSRLPGSDRVYVRVEGPLTYSRWIANLKAGRTFVTNGPMLDFALDQLAPGETWRRDRGADVPAVGHVRSQFPVDRVELVYNGAVAATVAMAEPSKDVRFDERLKLDRSGWVALRVSGPPHPDQPGGKVFAHTSAVYVEVLDRPIDAREDAEYFLAWIDRLWAAVRQRNRIPDRHQPQVEQQISAARAIYQRLATAPGK